MELLALIAELTSIAASSQQLKKPIKVPRPKHIKRSGGVRHAGDMQGQQRPADPYKRAVSMLAATTRGAVRRS
jgi:hypothetical protein